MQIIRENNKGYDLDHIIKNIAITIGSIKILE